MRYYRVEIGAAPSGNAGAVYTSLAGGKVDPGALQMEMDLPVYTFSAPMGNAYVRLTGVSLETVGQASDFNGAPIKVYGGMSAGLPLAKADQSGLLVQGTVFQAFGNWIGTDTSLELIIITNGGATQGDPVNLTIDWKKGTALGDAIKTTMGTAFPDYTVNINISQNLVLGEDEAGFYQTIEQFAAYVERVSQAILGGDYRGVQITLQEKTFNVFDGTAQASPKTIDFNDLIGQPTWIGPGQIQFNCVLRADLSVGAYVKMPPAQVGVAPAAAASPFRDKSVFQGSFQIDMVRHVGSYKQPDAQSWISTFNAHPVTPDVTDVSPVVIIASPPAP